MSQHRFHTTHQEKPVVVVLGWDRPLGYHFMTIESLAAGGDDEAPFLYSNLNEPRAFDLDLDHFRAVLQGLGITVPESMFTEAQADCINNVGNRSVEHQADGTMVEAAAAVPEPKVGDQINLDELAEQEKHQLTENSFGTVAYRGKVANVTRFIGQGFKIVTFE